MKHFHDYFWGTSMGTWAKGLIGTMPPVLALTFSLDTWAHGAQVFFGFLVPTLMAATLILDFLKKRRDLNQ